MSSCVDLRREQLAGRGTLGELYICLELWFRAQLHPLLAAAGGTDVVELAVHAVRKRRADPGAPLVVSRARREHAVLDAADDRAEHVAEARVGLRVDRSALHLDRAALTDEPVVGLDLLRFRMERPRCERVD